MPTLADVYEALTGQRIEAWQAFKIASFCVDSRRCGHGSLFVALKGEQTDGHLFIGDALAHGAQYIIAEKQKIEDGEWKQERNRTTWLDITNPISNIQYSISNFHFPCFILTANSLSALQTIAAWWRRKFSMQVIGVTGSVGKTVTKESIAEVLSQRYRTFKSEGNLNSETGLPLALLSLDDPAMSSAPPFERAVLEMAMYDIGEIAKLAEIAQPRIGVVTNVGPSHLERLGTLERIAQAKAELPQALPPDGWAILNGDDPRVRAMQAQTKARVMFYGLDPSNDLWASEVEGLGLQGTRFWLHRGHEHPLHVTIPLLGRHSVHTALAAAAVGLVEGLSWEEIIRGLQNVSAQLRLAAVSGINGSTLIDDTYNASPLSSIAALNLLHELDGRKIAVLADMLELGDYELEGHELVGRRAAEVCDLLVTVGLRARIMGRSAIDAGLKGDCVYFCQHKAEAIELLHKLLQPGDMVLIKGSRGMAMEDVVTALSVHRH